jgi:hypothetical protein
MRAATIRTLAPAAQDLAGHAHDVVERIAVAIYVEHAREPTGGAS